MSSTPATLPTTDRRNWTGTTFSGYELLIQILALGMLVSSTFMRAGIPIGVGDIYPAQVVAIALLPLAFWRTRTVRGALQAVLFGLVISALATVGSLSLPEPFVRYRIVAQFVINAFTMIVLLSLLSHLSRTALRQLVTFMCWLVFIAAMAQAFLAPGWNVRGTDTFGIPRPQLFFTEEGNLGQFAALLFCAALALSARSAAIVSATLVVISDSRGAYFIAISAALLAIPWIQSRKPLRVVVYLVPALLAALFILAAVNNWSIPVLTEDTGGIRQLDTQAILRVNNYSLFPWGGETLSVYDDTRGRQLGESYNVWLIDVVWKYGLGGIAFCVIWMWTFLIGIPKRIVQVKAGNTYWVPFGGLVGLMVDLEFRNPSGYSWMWVMLAVLYAVMASETRQRAGSDVQA